jgi:hypothetical protein
MTTLLKKVERYPPFLLFTWAGCRTKNRITVEEISKKSGVSFRTCERLKVRISWKGVKICVVDKLFEACGVDPFEENRLRSYLWWISSRNTKKPNRPMFNLNEREYQKFCARCGEWMVKNNWDK